MKKLILIFALLAAPLMASAQDDFTLTLPDQVSSSKDSTEVKPERDRYRSFNFGNVWVGSRRSTTFVLGAGNFPLRVWGMNVSGYDYDASSNCPSILFPGQECLIRVYFMPSSRGTKYGQFTLYVGNDRIVVDLWGRGVWRY